MALFIELVFLSTCGAMYCPMDFSVCECFLHRDHLIATDFGIDVMQDRFN